MNFRYFLFICLSFLACKGAPDVSTDHIVNIRLEGEPDQLNPVISTTAYSKQIEWQIFMPMLQYNEEASDLYPVLAVSRPVVKTIEEGKYKGGRTYRFRLRPEARWDDGKPIIASDFIFTLKTFMHPEIDRSGFGAFLSFIKKVEIDKEDSKMFTVYTNRSINLTEEMIGTMAIYPSHIYDPEKTLEAYDLEMFGDRKRMNEILEEDDKLRDFADSFKSSGHVNSLENINACGPYEISEWLQGQKIILKKKENWWASDLKIKAPAFLQHPDHIIYHFIVEDQTLTSLLKEQKVDVSAEIDPIIFENYKENQLMQSHFNFYTPLSTSYFFISMNRNDPRLKDQESRRAISHLVNVEEAIKVAMNGYGIRTTGPIIPAKSYYAKELKPIDFNVEKAKELLAATGWADQNGDGILEKEINGEKINFSIGYKYISNYPVAEKIGILLKNNAIKAGVEIELIPLESNRFLEDTRSRSFELYFSRWSQKPGLDDLRSIWHTSSNTYRGFNKTGFGTAYSDELIDSINVVLDEKKRTALYQEIQEIIYEDQAYVFLFVPRERIVIHKKIKGKTIALRPGYLENTFIKGE